MPYSGANDPKLPSNVKKLSPRKRRQWIHVYESARKRGADEGSAFAQANGVARRKNLVTIGERLAGILGRRNNAPPVQTRTYVLVKDANGRLRFFGRPTNVFRDRQKEIITTKAHQEYVRWVDESKHYPELWLWHAKGSRIGEVDWVEFDNESGVLSISGLIDKDKEDIAQKFADRTDLGMSHGFLARYNDHGDIVRYRTFECSVLPAEFCANEWTDFALWKDEDMAFSESKRKFLLEAGIGEDVVTKWEADNKALGEKLKGMGVDWKDDESGDDVDDEIAVLAGVVAAQSNAINALVDRVNQVAGFEERIAAVEKSFDDKVHDAFVAEIAKVPGGFVASKSDDNIVKPDDKRSKESMEWFERALLGK